MKFTLKNLQSLVAVALCAISAVVLSSCSKDDDEPANDNLSSIVVGVWAQDGDDDILVINANGTGMWYESPTAYQMQEISVTFIWTVKGEWFTMSYSDNYQQKCRPEKIISKNIIIWRDYDDYEDLNDSFGNYRLWTRERYPE